MLALEEMIDAWEFNTSEARTCFHTAATLVEQHGIRPWAARPAIYYFGSSALDRSNHSCNYALLGHQGSPQRLGFARHIGMCLSAGMMHKLMNITASIVRTEGLMGSHYRCW
jgi:hypothetical protein